MKPQITDAAKLSARIPQTFSQRHSTTHPQTQIAPIASSGTTSQSDDCTNAFSMYTSASIATPRAQTESYRKRVTVGAFIVAIFCTTVCRVSRGSQSRRTRRLSGLSQG